MPLLFLVSFSFFCMSPCTSFFLFFPVCQFLFKFLFSYGFSDLSFCPFFFLFPIAGSARLFRCSCQRPSGKARRHRPRASGRAAAAAAAKATQRVGRRPGCEPRWRNARPPGNGTWAREKPNVSLSPSPSPSRPIPFPLSFVLSHYPSQAPSLFLFMFSFPLLGRCPYVSLVPCLFLFFLYVSLYLFLSLFLALSVFV